DRPGRVRFVLTESALIVADNGAGFGTDEVRAICGLGRSSKDPRKSVGYKGLGLKSVGEISTRPQIISGGTGFEFEQRRGRAGGGGAGGELAGSQRRAVYVVPLGVGAASFRPDRSVLEKALAGGFRTVLRLPLKAEVARTEVEAHLIESLLPRLLLF